MAPPLPKPELLASTSSEESFFAALDAGADALCVVLRQGRSAQRQNGLTFHELKELIPFAHRKERKVYIDFNRLLPEAEVPRVAEGVWEAVCLEADALIVQDLGLWALCREGFPEIGLHASGRLAVHNSAGVRQLQAMGFSRVTLARECTLLELAAIRRQSSLRLEVVVHGSLCFSITGLCLGFTTAGGGSAIDGGCAGLCRNTWRSEGSSSGQEAPLFSLSDLCLVGRVAELRKMGVHALAIEGAERPAEYVHSVVRAYRKVLDAPPDDQEGSLGAAREILRAVATRRFTEGYAAHPRPKEVFFRGRDPDLGYRVGTVARWKNGSAAVDVTEPVSRGESLRIRPAVGGADVEVTIGRFRREKRRHGERIFFELKDPVRRGDAAYRVDRPASQAAEQVFAFGPDRSVRGRGRPVRMRASVRKGSLCVDARSGPVTAHVSTAVPMHQAQTRSLDAGILSKHLGRMGSTPYYLAGVTLEGGSLPVVIPPSSLKEVRDRVVEALERAQERERSRRLAVRREKPVCEPRATGEAKRLWIRVERARALWAVANKSFHRLVISMTRECLRARDRLVQKLGSRQSVMWEIPVWIPEGDLLLYQKQLEVLVGEGYREFAVMNLGHLDLLRGLDSLTLWAGWPLWVLNRWAAQGLTSLGVQGFTICPGTDRHNVRGMATHCWPARPLAYTFGHLPVFTTRLEPATTTEPGTTYTSSEGFELFWQAAPKNLGQNSARFFEPKPLSWSHHMSELFELGVRDFLFDLGGRTFGQHETDIVLKKFHTQRPFAGTTDSNYGRLHR